MRDHEPVIYENFKGLWRPTPISGSSDLQGLKDNDQTCPDGYGLDCINFNFNISSMYVRERFSSFTTALSSFGAEPISVHIITNIPSQDGEFLVGDGAGDLYHFDGTTTTLIYSGPGTNRYHFLPYLDRIYIAIAGTFNVAGVSTEPLLVYQASGIRDAGGTSPSTAANVANSSSGVIQRGTRFFGVSYETDTGFITPPTATNPTSLVCPGNQLVAFTNIPTGPAGTVARWLFATRAIASPVPGGTLESYQYYPVARIANNTTTSLNVNFYDSQLLNDMSYLSDIYENPPGGNSICLYHNRVVITAPATDEIHNAIFSRINDPETFDQVTGVAVIDPTKTYITAGLEFGLTNSQVYRDAFYLFKITSTYALVDNGDEPAFWSGAVIDQTIGSRPNGIANTNTAGGESVDYLLVAGASGIYLFTGYYHRPELSWKFGQDLGSVFADINLVNDYRNKKLYFIPRGSRNLYLFDYKTVSPDFSNYSSEIKISIWELGEFNGNNLDITCGVVQLNTATGQAFLVCGEENTEQLVRLGNEAGPLDLFETFGDGREPLLVLPSVKNFDESLLHVAAVRFKLNNNPLDIAGQQLLELLVSDGNFNLPSQSVVNENSFSTFYNNAQAPTILVNKVFQRPRLSIKFSNLITSVSSIENGGPGINRIILYIKPIYATLPYQYAEPLNI